MSCIYALLDPRTKKFRYIGKTTKKPKIRFWNHMAIARSGSTRHVSNWIRSLINIGLEPELSILESNIKDCLLNKREAFWIQHYRMLGHDLTNHTDGGEGRSGGKHSPETILKIVRKTRGQKRSIEVCNNIRKARSGSQLPKDVKRKISEKLSGRKLSNSHISNTRKALLGKPGKKLSVNSEPGNHKLSIDEVRQIRASLENRRILAVRYMVSPATITNIRSGRSWNHID